MAIRKKIKSSCSNTRDMNAIESVASKSARKNRDTNPHLLKRYCEADSFVSSLNFFLVTFRKIVPVSIRMNIIRH